MKLLHPAIEPNHVELVWAVRKVTTTQAKYISLFYGQDTLKTLRGAEQLSVRARAQEKLIAEYRLTFDA